MVDWIDGSHGRAHFIRYAMERDIPFVFNGTREICRIEMQKPESKAKQLGLIRKAVRNKEIRVLTIGDEPAGFIQFKFSKKNPYGLDYGDYERRFCWIEWMYVSKRFRRMGVASGLHQDLRAICRKRGIKEILLDVFQVNAGAIKFYKEEGFSEFIHIMKEKV